MCDSLLPHGLEHSRPPCPSLSLGVCPNSCSLHQWFRPAISSSDALSLLTSIFPSIMVFCNESPVFIRWPKYWSFSYSISPSNDYSGLISAKIDWFDLLAVQGTFRSLFQDHSSKASVVLHSACFPVQLLQLYMTTGKTIHILDCMEINYTPIKMYRTELKY